MMIDGLPDDLDLLLERSFTAARTASAICKEVRDFGGLASRGLMPEVATSIAGFATESWLSVLKAWVQFGGLETQLRVATGKPLAVFELLMFTKRVFDTGELDRCWSKASNSIEPAAIQNHWPQLQLLAALPLPDLEDLHNRAASEMVLAWQRRGSDPEDDLPQYVTLDQMAASVSKSKRTLERLKTDGKLPYPDVDGGGGKSDEWLWRKVRDILMKEYGRLLPERFPSQRKPLAGSGRD